MTVFHSAELDDLLRLATLQCSRAKATPGAQVPFIQMVFDQALWAIRSSAILEDRIDRARKLAGVMAALATLTQDENGALSAPHNGDPVGSAARKRAILDTRPALAAWHVEQDEMAAVAAAAAAETAARKAEHDHAARPALILALLRASGVELSLNARGRLCAPPGAVLDVGYGLEVYPERAVEFVAILKREAAAAAAEAARLVPVPIWMTGAVAPFQPVGTVTIAASTVSANGALPPGGDAVLVTNSTAAVAFVRVDVGSPVATAADTPVLPGSARLLAAPSTVTAVAVLLSAGSGGVYVTRGSGTAI